jgi:hypothetical protein
VTSGKDQQRVSILSTLKKKPADKEQWPALKKRPESSTVGLKTKFQEIKIQDEQPEKVD